jgi:gamma-glutamyltranspeptidase / glutathione hydrolase
MRRILILLTCAAVGCGAPAPSAYPGPWAGRGVPSDWPHTMHPEPARSAAGMVTTDAPLATEVGLEILRAGGNAVDAAIATAFALAVVYPEAGNLGGGGFIVVRLAAGEVATLDFREMAPTAATRDMYLDERGELTDLSITGHLAAGVPGSVMGLWEAHHRYASLTWPELLEPAIALAEHGFLIDRDFAESIVDEQERLRRFAASAALFLPDGRPLSEGTHWRNPDLAAVLRRIARQGPDGFYAGETADLIVEEMRRGGGIVTHADLAAYRAVWRDPVVFEYRGRQVVSMAPPSSGGLTLALIANILEGYDLTRLGWRSTEHLHLLTEAARRAFADRNAFLGDPDFVEIPADRFLSRQRAAELRQGIDRRRATPSQDVAPPATVYREGSHTTHFGVVDAAGNAVALTTTINSLYGSAVTVTGAGFLLNNEMDDFTARPGTPNQFGLVQGEANAIAPGKRMLSAMTPTIVVEAGRPVLVTGARGGPRIITAVFQVLSNALDFGMDIGAAVHAPRIHHQHMPDVLFFEANGLQPDDVHALEARGHLVRPRDGYIGNAPSLLWRDSVWTGVADPRQGGRAAGTDR